MLTLLFLAKASAGADDAAAAVAVADIDDGADGGADARIEARMSSMDDIGCVEGLRQEERRNPWTPTRRRATYALIHAVSSRRCVSLKILNGPV
jgi:hypothetical protein